MTEGESMKPFAVNVFVAAVLAVNVAGCSVSAQSEDLVGSSPVTVAQNYIGLDERKDRWALKQLLDIDPRRIPWCAAFVNRILEISGFEGTNSLMARSFLGIGTRVRAPIRGDIVVLTRGSDPRSGHVGFYMGEEEGYIRVLGGNQGRAVSIALYPKSKVLGYRRIAGTNVNLTEVISERPRVCRSIEDPLWSWTDPQQCSG